MDIAFRGDASWARQGASAANLVVLRHIALTLLKQERTAKVGIKNKRLKAGWDERYLIKVIAAYNAIALDVAAPLTCLKAPAVERDRG
ncbi:MAG: hypothetical protein LC793_15020 [Thermomicrobia bacterium]|nr:hypothetical protein [Thermomicrobia bacterium]